MIPKKIHYCWFGNGKMSKDIISSIKSWKRIMPDYEIILWNENNFDINSVAFVKEAYSTKKWAFVADYVRLYVLYKEGGIYLDTDIYVLKKFDPFLEHDFFTSLEYEENTKIFENVINSDLNDIQGIGKISFQSGLIGSISKHPFLKDCLDWYNNRNFILKNGTYLTKPTVSEIYPAIAQKYGFRYINEPQKLKINMVILPFFLFSQGEKINITNETYAVHWWEGSWRKNDNTIVGMLKRNNIIRKLLGYRPITSIEKKIQKSLNENCINKNE